MSGLDELLSLAEEGALRAGETLMEHFIGPASGVDHKTTETDLVSDADRAAESFLLDFISSKRPQDGVFAEEGGRENSESGLTWVVDPLDGTINFLFRIPHWCVSVGVEDENGGVVGVIRNPNLDETFRAARDGGATLNSEPIRVSERRELATALIGTGFAYDSEARRVQAEQVSRILPRARDIRRAGSAALDLAFLACGRLDGFYEASMERWDKSAGVLIATEAGATITELPPPKEGLSPGVIGANEVLHRALVELLLA
ncbi:MAG TPA: inositol monophosphatase family protein [Actinomycetota bacterium]|nr:inositol monophosphatase family protein [Actinomycetota bacterium]